MARKIQHNPSTGKISRNPVTGKIQMARGIVPVTPRPGDCCGSPQDWPSALHVDVSGIGIVSGCVRYNLTFYGNDWSLPDVNGTYLCPIYRDPDFCIFRKIEIGAYSWKFYVDSDCTSGEDLRSGDGYIQIGLTSNRLSVAIVFSPASVFLGFRDHPVSCASTLEELWGGDSIVIINNEDGFHFPDGTPGGTCTISI